MKIHAYFISVAIVTGLGGWGYVGLANAQTKTKKNAGRVVSKTGQFKASPWAVRCRKKTKTKAGGCQLSHTIVQPSRKRVLLGTRIRYSKRTKAYVMVFQMPHGLIIPKGVLTQVDKNKPRSVQIFTSDRNGVYSTMSLNSGFISQLKNGTTMKVSFVAANTQRVTVPVNLKGFTAGFAKLSK